MKRLQCHCRMTIAREIRRVREVGVTWLALLTQPCKLIASPAQRSPHPPIVGVSMISIRMRKKFFFFFFKIPHFCFSTIIFTSPRRLTLPTYLIYIWSNTDWNTWSRFDVTVTITHVLLVTQFQKLDQKIGLILPLSLGG